MLCFVGHPWLTSILDMLKWVVTSHDVVNVWLVFAWEIAFSCFNCDASRSLKRYSYVLYCQNIQVEILLRLGDFSVPWSSPFFKRVLRIEQILETPYSALCVLTEMPKASIEIAFSLELRFEALRFAAETSLWVFAWIGL